MVEELADDHPISRQHNRGALIDADEFDRRRLVSAVAHLLERNVPSLSSMVFGVEGPWGCGKTSFKNMVIEQIENDWVTANRQSGDKFPYPVIVDFNPWMFSNAENVTEMLFATIAQKLDGETGELESQRRERRQRSKDAIGKASDKVSSVAEAGGKAADLIGSPIAVGLHLASIGFGVLSQKMKPDPKEPLSLKQAHDKLVESLKMKEHDFRLYVFIDEIDRLDDQGIIDIFKSLKAVGDLPRTVYIPIYDRRIVTKALGQASRFSGEDYLGKIVQMPIPMPAVPFRPATDSVLERCGLTNLDDNDSKLCEHTLSIYIMNKRDANRLCNAYILRHAVLGDETNPADLFAITAIQLFHPSLASWMQMAKKMLVDREDFQRNSLTADFVSLGEETSSGKLDEEKRLLQKLFPKRKHAEDAEISSETENPESRKIRFWQHFDMYFTLTPEFGPVLPRKDLMQWLDGQYVLDMSDADFMKGPHSQLQWMLKTEPTHSNMEKDPANVRKLLDAYRIHYPIISDDSTSQRSVRDEIDGVIAKLLECANKETVVDYGNTLMETAKNTRAPEELCCAIIQIIRFVKLVEGDNSDSQIATAIMSNSSLRMDLTLSVLPLMEHCLQKSVGFSKCNSHDIAELLRTWSQWDPKRYEQTMQAWETDPLPWKYLAMIMAYVYSYVNDHIIVDAVSMPQEAIQSDRAGHSGEYPDELVARLKPDLLKTLIDEALHSGSIPADWTRNQFVKLIALDQWAKVTLQRNLPIKNPLASQNVIWDSQDTVWVENLLLDNEQKPVVVVRVDAASDVIAELERKQRNSYY